MIGRALTMCVVMLGTEITTARIHLLRLLPARIGRGPHQWSVHGCHKHCDAKGRASRPDSEEDLQFWTVAEGVLIVTYSKVSQKITRMTFWLADERAKAFRRTFELSVTSFDTGSGAMTIRTKKGESNSSAK
jgi:hypothetical protein